MDNRLESYIQNCDNEFTFKIFADLNDDSYEKITRPLLKSCINPDGSGPNKGRASISKMNNGFLYIIAKNEDKVVGAESFQCYTINEGQAIPAVIYYETMKAYNKAFNTNYSDIKTFLKDHKKELMIFESHRLISTVRDKHLAAVMIHKLEKMVRERFTMLYPDKKFIPVFFETVNQYSRKAFELCGYTFKCDNKNYSNEKKMGSKIKYIGGKFEF